MLLLGLLACSDFELRKLKPDVTLSASTLDFDEVVVGTRRTGTLLVTNDGGGLLHVSSLEATGSADFTLESQLPDIVEPGESVELSVRYAPDTIGPDEGAITLVTDDPDQPSLALGLLGEGVEPGIDVDPETLWFGEVSPGARETLTVDVNARGQGTLIVDDIGFVADEATAFSFELPEGYELPLALTPGTGFTIAVTFAPADATAWDGALYVVSNDPDDAEVHVRLLGNADATGEEPPRVEITWPDWGNQLLAGEAHTLRGVIVDDADAPEDLVALWYGDGALLGTSTPDSSGAVSLTTSALPQGELTIRLAALDTDGGLGEDEVEVAVYDPEEPMPYLLTGGGSLWDYWNVDDDIVITLDGVEIFRDSNDTQDDHPPLAIEARAGQVLRVVATDVNYCDQALGALTLHWGTGESQALNEAWCRSSCPSHACYDAAFDGPWPAIFFDESFTISIP